MIVLIVLLRVYYQGIIFIIVNIKAHFSSKKVKKEWTLMKSN